MREPNNKSLEIVKLAQGVLRERGMSFAAEAIEELKPRLVLTARELEVTALLANGVLAKDIAVQLHIAVNTVEVHRFNIFYKIGVHSQAELVHWALRHRVVGNKFQHNEYDLRGAVSLESVIQDAAGICSAWANKP